MNPRSSSAPGWYLISLCRGTFRLLASLQLGLALLVTLAALLAWATLLEAKQGREFAQWYVYGSRWFVGLLAVLGANILAATLIRFPWRWRQLGFVVTHAGLLVLLGGAILTFFLGIEGQIVLQEKQQTDQFLVTHRSSVTVVGDAGRGRLSTQFSFAPGPVDWPADRTLDFGADDGLGLKVLRFYRHARQRIEWVADQRDYQGPALHLRLHGPTGNTVAEDWLAGNVFGGEAIIGPTKYELLPLPVATMREDFVKPPAELPGAGVLSMHYAGRQQRIPVDGNMGRRIVIGDDGAAVEIAQYLPDAKPTPRGGFVSVSTKPRNPLLELNVYLPGREQPTRQVAFALRPLLNLDGVHGEVCPVRFWYHHAGLRPVPGAVFAQTPDGKLYCRAAVNGAYEEAVEIQPSGRVHLGGQFRVVVQQYLPRARQEVSFLPVEPARGPDHPPEAAALVAVTAGGERRAVWLQRGDAQWGMQTIFIHQGSLTVTFGYEPRPLGYSLELEDFTCRSNPGGVGQAAFSSTVRVTDPAAGQSQRREVSPNRPLTHGQFTLYQSSFRESAHGEASVLTVARDPGRLLKYLGSLMVCVGMATRFAMRSSLFQGVPAQS